MLRQGLQNSESETLDVRPRSFGWFRQREVGNAGAVPAVHGFHADLTVGVVSLSEGDRDQYEVIFRPAVRTLEDCHGRTMRPFVLKDQLHPSFNVAPEVGRFLVHARVHQRPTPLGCFA